MQKCLLVLFLMCLCLFGWSQPRDTVINTTLYFKVNTAEFIEDDNYNKFIQEQLPFIQEHRKNLKHIKLTAAASPEGSYSRNRELARMRAESINEILDLDEVVTISEDYNGLYDLIESSDEPWKNQILKILSTSGNVKHDLINSGHWWRLKQYYFPKLRKIDIKLHFLTPTIIKTTEIDTLYIHDTLYVHDTIYKIPPYKKYPILSIKTNLIEDIIGAPNVHAELYTYVWNLSLEFEYSFPWWKNDGRHFYYQALNGAVGVRKYFNNNYDKWYVGVYGNTGYYDFTTKKDNGWQGEERGAGLSAGRVWRKGNWRFEAFVRGGWLNSNYDTYHAGEPFEGKYYYDWWKRNEDFVPRRFTLNYFGVTMIGFNITYDIIRIRRYEIPE